MTLPTAAPMTDAQLLSQLHDIAEPAAIGWWPPAPGWWLLAVGSLLLLAGLTYWLVRHQRNNRFRKQALRELSDVQRNFQVHSNPQDYLRELNHLLKRIAITRYGRDQVAPLHGQDWCRFLSSRAKGVDFTGAPGALLGDGLYRQPQDIPVPAIQQLALQWIRRCQ